MQVINVDIPNHIELVVAETGPGVKGNTVSGGTKAAVLETGASIQVSAVCVYICIYIQHGLNMMRNSTFCMA